MRVVRVLLLLSGLAALAFGGLLLLDSVETLPDVVVWMTAGVLLHDLVWAPLAFAVALFGMVICGPALRVPLMTGVVVSAALTLVAVPVLGKPGARPDNPSLLDRNYVAGWLVALALIWLVVGLWVLARRRGARSGRQAQPPGS